MYIVNIICAIKIKGQIQNSKALYMKTIEELDFLKKTVIETSEEKRFVIASNYINRKNI